MDKSRDDLYIDCAVYGGSNNEPDKDYAKLLERKVYDVAGLKTLIGRNSHTPEQFWTIYNRPNWVAGVAFFVIGMHPLASRIARRTPWPVLVSPELFARHAAAWEPYARVVPPGAWPGRNGKVRGVMTGVALARHDAVVIADDDVRYDGDVLAGASSGEPTACTWGVGRPPPRTSSASRSARPTTTSPSPVVSSRRRFCPASWPSAAVRPVRDAASHHHAPVRNPRGRERQSWGASFTRATSWVGFTNLKATSRMMSIMSMYMTAIASTDC